MRKLAGLLLVASLTFMGTPRAVSSPVTIQEFVIPAAVMQELTAEFLDGVAARHPAGTWAPMRFEPTDAQLAKLGLPPAEVLRAQRYPEPTLVDKTGRKDRTGSGSNARRPPKREPQQDSQAVASFAGTGWFGIRPGALLLIITSEFIAICSMAHVYGSAGSYQISTAGHCGKTGDIATVVGVVGNGRGVASPVLIDFGRFATSHDGGLGNDWALIDVDAAYQHLVTPTMAFWGGPQGMYTPTGATVGVSFPGGRIIPDVSLNPDPTLAQAVLHYGHGLGVGAGGTPRASAAIHWGTTHFMFSGVINQGDSGSGANTAAGDTVGAVREAAGIITHIWVDPLMRQGVGIMGGTRATQVQATLANGQLVPYPVPAPGLP